MSIWATFLIPVFVGGGMTLFILIGYYSLANAVNATINWLWR